MYSRRHSDADRSRRARSTRALDEMRARVVVFSPTRASGTRAR
jgi:hypothetical protein